MINNMELQISDIRDSEDTEDLYINYIGFLENMVNLLITDEIAPSDALEYYLRARVQEDRQRERFSSQCTVSECPSPVTVGESHE